MSDYFERKKAEMESERIAVSDAYFNARPQLFDKRTEKAFNDGFERAWDLVHKRYDCIELNPVD